MYDAGLASFSRASMIETLLCLLDTTHDSKLFRNLFNGEELNDSIFSWLIPLGRNLREYQIYEALHENFLVYAYVLW